jgi:hypothetical protein
MEVEMLNGINLLLGSALLVAGRKLFWLFVAVLGFIVGLQVTQQFFHGPEFVSLIVAVIVGIIFALLAIFVETIAIGIAGFLAGGFVLGTLANMLGVNGGAVYWVVYIIGGILGVALVMLLLDWALIALTSLVGASLIVQSWSSAPIAGGVLFILLFILGIIIQGSVLLREENPPRRRYVRRVRRRDV